MPRSAQSPSSRTVSDLVRRTAWLMLGAAIGFAAGLLGISLAQVVAPAAPVAAVLVTVLCLLPIPLLGLIPGARELEVTAARGMLGSDAELVSPEQPRAEHRLRCVAWVTLHLVMGLAAAVLLVGLIPGAVVLTTGSVTGAPLSGVALPAVRGPLPVLGVLAVGAAACLACLALVWLLGLLARRLVPTFLGPTSKDLLLLVESRLAAETEHTRLARELHDGIGHALTIIAVQAASGRRAVQRGTADPSPSLEVIESTAQHALTELDTMLGVLRDGPAPTQPEPDLRNLEQLVHLHRQSGLDIVAELADTSGLPEPLSRAGYRIVAEALINTQRHAGEGVVGVRVEAGPDTVAIEVSSPLGSTPAPTRPDPTRPGRGLDGIRERVRLFGGTLDAGPQARRWVVRASLPTAVRHA